MEKKVSIIIPAYNVVNYIDKCLESVVNQNYGAMEIVLVNDGSTDGTAEKCTKWAESDDRIMYISKCNEGQGIARNLGIEKARGQYLIFVDADDWIGPNYVRRLFEAIEEREDDVVICDFVRVNEVSGQETIFSQNLNLVNSDDMIEFVEPSFWGKIFRKDLFIKNEIEQPSHYFEDITVVPFILLTASHISYADDCYYFYLQRKTSTVNSMKSLGDRGVALESLLHIFEERNLLEEYKEQLIKFILMRCRADLSKAKILLKERYVQVFRQHYDLLNEYFGIELIDEEERNIAVWGGYNLYRIGKILVASDVKYRYMASSIISATSNIIPELNMRALRCSNTFREENVINDCTKRFMNMNPSEFKYAKYLLIDFMEERFPIGRYGTDFITVSDAYEETSGMELSLQYLTDEDRECQWKKSCKQFISRIQCYFPVSSIVLVRMKLTEYYGVKGKEAKFDNIKEIESMNLLLDSYYDFFASECPGIIDVVVENENYYYTDINFRHGCKPWHLNQQAYYEIYKKIQKRIEEIHG